MFGENPSAGKVNPHNGAVVRRDEELFDDEAEFEELKEAYGLTDDGTRFLRELGLV